MQPILKCCLILLMAGVPIFSQAAEDEPLPEELQLDGGSPGKEAVPTAPPTENELELSEEEPAGADQKPEQIPEEKLKDSPPPLQFGEVFKLLDSLTFGKELFLPGTSFVKSGKLESKVLK